MAVITVNPTDTGGITELWDLPARTDKSYIPRGIFRFNGTNAIAAKINTNETRITITLNFTAPYSYLLKSFNMFIFSDDQVLDFDAQGVFRYTLASTASANPHFGITSDGIYHTGAGLAAGRSYNFPGGSHPRVWVDGNADDCNIQVADISTDASTAGDVFWDVEFWIYDADQRLNYPINTAEPVLCL